MVSRRIALRTGGAALLGLAGCTAPDGSGDTPTPTDVPTRTDPPGASPTVGSPTGEPGGVVVEGADPAWTRELDAPVRGGPTYVDGRVAVAAGPRVYGLDAATGETAWTLDPPATPDDDHERLAAALRVHEGTLYALVGVSFGTGANEHTLHALTPDGEERWRYATGVEAIHSFVGFGGGRAVLGTGDDQISGRPAHPVFAVDLADGERQWTAESGDVRGGAVGPDLATVETYGAVDGFGLDSGDRRFRFAPDGDVGVDGSAVGGGMGFVAASVDGGDPDVYAFDAATGETAWTGVGVAASSLRYHDDLYAGGGGVVRVGADGEKRWSYDPGGPVVDVPFDDEALYTNAGSRLVAVARDDGAELWSTEISDLALPRVRSGDAVVSHAGRLRRVYAHDASDGTERWRAQVPGGYTHGPTAGDGAAYVATSDATVVRVPL